MYLWRKEKVCEQRADSPAPFALCMENPGQWQSAAVTEELSKSQAATVNAEKFMGIVRKHLAFEELTPTLLREMIEKIVVHECSYDENGTRRQDIEIYYSFVGKIDLPEA